MLLAERLSRTGGFFYRWRSFVPLIFLPLAAASLPAAEPIERLAGDGIGDAFEILCLTLVVCGLALRGLTIGHVARDTSGRKTRVQVASVLNTTGLYSLTRNPLYLGNLMVYLGVALFTQNLLLGVALALFLVIYYERIILAEEAFLLHRSGAEYREWAQQVPAFLPRRSGWQRPALGFSIRTVLRREYPGWFAAMAALCAIEVGGDAFGLEEGPWIDAGWLAALITAALVYVVLRLLKNTTSLLKVTER